MYDSVEVDDTLVYFNAFVLHSVTVLRIYQQILYRGTD
jgi:hypothetical protein